MLVQILDRANGKELQVVTVQEAAERIAEVLELDANEVRDGLLAGVNYRTAGCHYQLKKSTDGES